MRCAESSLATAGDDQMPLARVVDPASMARVSFRLASPRLAIHISPAEAACSSTAEARRSMMVAEQPAS